MIRRFAQDTDVPIDRTRLELEALLRAYKARATAVFTSNDESAVVFEMHERLREIRILMNATCNSLKSVSLPERYAF